MKTFMTTAAVLAVLTAPVLAQQPAGSESKGEPQASGAKESAKEPEKGAMGQGQAQPRATTGAASDPAKKKDPTQESAGSGDPPEKTGVTTGGGSGGTGGGGAGGGSK
jgi:hypothetical protein